MGTSIQLPSGKMPVYMIGAGGIVNTAHLPAYSIAGYHVAGIFDIDYEKAKSTAGKFNISTIFTSIDEAIKEAPPNAIFDVAVPGSELISVLEKLPWGSNVLMQKPMGENFAAAQKILAITREKEMTAGVNFQLRYAPFIIEAMKMLQDGLLGELTDIEVNINVFTPWHMWSFLYGAPRTEILYHSIHYIDLIRNFLGEPISVYAKTTKHPAMNELASVRSNIIMDYGDTIRANILTNHCHAFGQEKQQSYIKFEGTTGAVKIELGVLKNYPAGEADKFEYIVSGGDQFKEWKTKKIEGSWFPHAFIGSMSQVMMAAEGVIGAPDNSVEDCIYTMACVEAAYRSNKEGGVSPGKI
jgi:predicted dehydrogenase